MHWKFPSSSGPGVHTTTLGTDGRLSCSCLGWTRRRFGQVRECKHTKEVIAAESLRVETRGDYVYAVGLVTSPAPLPAATPVPRRPPSAASASPTLIDRAQKAAPMLASAMTDPVTGKAFNARFGKEWALEEKLDGHRVTAIVADDKTVSAFSRPRAGAGGAKSRTLPPAIETLLATLTPGIYDGELCVPGGTSSDVVVIGAPLVLVLFDVLELDGVSFASAPYAHRRRILLEELAGLPAGQTSISTVESVTPTWARVEAIWKAGGEGAVLKRLTSTYRPGYRTPDWVKVKSSHSAVLTVAGFDAGKSGPCSAFVLREPGGVETTVKVLGNDLLRQVSANPRAFIGRRVVITYQQRTASGTFRHPIFDHFAGVGE